MIDGWTRDDPPGHAADQRLNPLIKRRRHQHGALGRSGEPGDGRQGHVEDLGAHGPHRQ